jgi:hypothetical protein
MFKILFIYFEHKYVNNVYRSLVFVVQLLEIDFSLWNFMFVYFCFLHLFAY